VLARKGSSPCGLQWRTVALLLRAREEPNGLYRRGSALARRFTSRSRAMSCMGATWAQRGGNVQWGMAVTPWASDDGRRGVADARATRRARRWGRDGGVAQGVPRHTDQRAKAGLGVRAQRRRGRRATSARPTRSRAPGAKNSLDWHTLTEFFSKKLNYSGETFEYQ
jgi:hypothetical protein